MSSSHCSLEYIQSILPNVASRDRYRLGRDCERLAAKTAKAVEHHAALAALAESLHVSIAKVEARRARLPVIEFPEGLPISDKREQIAAAIGQHQVVIIAGETGSGKTTQLPKICLSQGFGVKGLIGHTQPRRLAARSVAGRIAEELNTSLGYLVGYQVRFTDQVSDTSLIKVMTDGILLAEIQQDPYLNRYDTLIIDEAHERSLNIDFLLGYLKSLLPKRPDLNVIITSATIDVDKFSRHFNGAPIIEVSGRTYPVELRYRPLDAESGQSIIEGIIQTLDEIMAIDHQGDILVFLSGEGDIRQAALQLRRANIPHLQIVPLYARLSLAEQNTIFQVHQGRRIVLATNVAETSLTVPGIRYVIDPGYARISRYSFRSKVQRLPIEPISQASANQRKGRCGRVSAGVCFRLYSEADFNGRDEFTEPEILRTNLASVILKMTQLRLGDVRRFSFIDMPDHRLISDGYTLLQALQAVNERHRLTPLGRRLAQLPIDPQLGRMLLAAESFACVQEILAIVSALSIQDPRERPADKRQAADQQHRQYWHEHSDFLAYWSLWQAFEQERQQLSNKQLSNKQLQQWCKQRYLAYNRMREWRDIHTQLKRSAGQLGLKCNTEPASYDNIHRSLLAGLLGNIGNFSKEKAKDYIGARNRRFAIFPGSSQFKKTPPWILSAQLLETSKLYAHTVAAVEPKWILDSAPHLVKRHYSEPHYDARQGQVMAFAKVTLYGLVLIEKQPVAYSRIDAQQSREIFIRAALVEGLYAKHNKIAKQLASSDAQQHFFLHQQQLLDELHLLEAKSRRRDIVVDEQQLYHFYDQRIPNTIINLDGFEHWRKQQQHNLLFVEREHLMQHAADGITQDQFPDQLIIEGRPFAVYYHFDPSHQNDGVTIRIPVELLHLVPPATLEWLVPGFLREKIIAMLKALPKQWRKQLVPIPAQVDQVLPMLSNTQQALTAALSQALHRKTGIQLPDDVWQSLPLDTYYRMNICVIDSQGKPLDQGRDLLALRKQYKRQLKNNLDALGDDFQQQGLNSWSFGELPQAYELRRNGLNIKAYPGLVADKEHVSLTLFDDPQQAKVDSTKGIARLLLLSSAQAVKYCRKQLLKNRDIGLSMVTMGDREQVLDDILLAAIKQLALPDGALIIEGIETAEQFSHLLTQVKPRLLERAEAIADILHRSLQSVVAIKKHIKQSKNPLMIASAAQDIEQQLAQLFYPGVLFDTPWQWLQQYPRYLQAIALRLEKVPMQVQKDRQYIGELEALWSRYHDTVAAAENTVYLANDALVEYRWLIEELRVSLFAQTLGTLKPVSVKRLNKLWQLC
ncbi:MAG: ATP-dependent RNA helicase HrpA [Pseudomonadota bacterium]